MMVICWTHGSYLRRRERGAITPQKIQSAIKCLILLSAEELDYQLFIIKKKRGKCEKQLISSADEPHHTQVLKQNGQLCVCVCVCVCVCLPLCLDITASAYAWVSSARDRAEGVELCQIER